MSKSLLLLLCCASLGVRGYAVSRAPAPSVASSRAAAPQMLSMLDLTLTSTSEMARLAARVGEAGGLFRPSSEPSGPVNNQLDMASLASRIGEAGSLFRAPSPPRSEFAAHNQLDSLLGLFDGEFDNLGQFETERKAGLTPRFGGGHEHIHCSLRDVKLPGAPGRHKLAVYYFDGDPTAVFRARLYRLDALAHDEQFGPCVRMQIYRLQPEVFAALRAAGGDAGAVAWGAVGTEGSPVDASLYIEGADVFWRWWGERERERARAEASRCPSPLQRGRPLTPVPPSPEP